MSFETGFLERDQAVVHKEENSEVVYKVVRNDGTRENWKHLIDLKCIVVEQLKSMGAEYATRLIMDRGHESIVILEGKEVEQKQMIGGIVYKPFYKLRFIEIAFLVIGMEHQFKGFGTRLMNVLKSIQKVDFDYLLTYAD